MPLQPAVPMSEQRADAGRDQRCHRPQRQTELKCDAIAHNGFPAALRFDTAFVAPQSHAHHRRLFMKALAGP
jgi:hypothetical protein